MSTAHVQAAPAAIQTAPRGARLAAEAFLAFSRWLRAAARQIAAPRARSRAEDIAELQAMARQLRQSDPAWSAELFAVAARYEGREGLDERR